MLIDINKIKVNDRLRDDMGDIGGLAESIQQRGLLHPIIVDENNCLIAGGRRLAAHKLLGLKDIEARTLADLDDREKRLIELEENTKRKDLTPYEQSKHLTQLAEAAKEVLRDEFPSRGDGKPKVEIGRPPKADRRERVAERLGVSTGAITEARQHVAAVDKHPVLIDFPKKQAIQAARVPDDVARYEELLVHVPEMAEFTIGLRDRITHGENMRLMSKGQRDRYMEPYRTGKKELDNALAASAARSEGRKKIHNLIDGALRSRNMVSEDRINAWLESTFDRRQIEDAVEWLQCGIDELTKLQNGLKRALNGPRKVGSNEQTSEKAN